MSERPTDGRGGRAARPGRRAATVLAVLALPSALALSGCGDSPAAPEAGHYPIATPAARNAALPTAGPTSYQVVTAGDPVLVHLPGTDVLATVTGPDIEAPTPEPGQPVTRESAPGVLTVTLTTRSGTAQIPADGFVTLDPERHGVPFHADETSVTVSPDHPATLHLSAEFTSGDTLLTWQPGGRPMVTWDFSVEID